MPAPQQSPGARAATATAAGLLFLRLLGRSFLTHRILGLAAEVAFFAILSLPPLVFGMAGAAGFVADAFDAQSVQSFRDDILRTLNRFLSDSAITDVIAPTMDAVLAEGRIDVISLGFVLALWSGSRTLVVLMDTIAIMYGRAGHRSILKSWATSFLTYLGLIVVCAVVVPAVLVGPRVLLGDAAGLAAVLWFWIVVWVGGLSVLTGIFHLCLPRGRGWFADLPGAVVTLLIWLIGSVLLQVLLALMLNTPTLYGPLGTPIAVLMWLYLMALAVLIGAAVNASIEGVRHPDAPAVETAETDADGDPGA